MDTAPTGTGTGTQVSLHDGNGEEGEGVAADWVVVDVGRQREGFVVTF